MLGGTRGDPELFRLRSLLFRADSIGWPLWLLGIEETEEVAGNWEEGRRGEEGVGLLVVTVGLKVTLRCGFGGPDWPEL